MATLRKFAKMTSGGKYHEEQINYWGEQCIKEARAKHPEYKHLSNEELLKKKEVLEGLKDNPMTPKWKGSLASTYGVADKVIQMDEWRNACSGYTPDSDINGKATKLNNNAFKIGKETTEDGAVQAKFIEKDGYRMGVEFLFTTSKEFSVLLNLSEGEQKTRLLKAFNKAVEKTMAKVEDMTYCRKKENGEIRYEKSKGLLWAQFNHIENRGADIQTSDEHAEPNINNHTKILNTTKDKVEVEAEPQPNTHAHVTTLNTTKDKDGNNMSLSYDEITRNIPLLNAEFSMTLTDELRGMGYEMRALHVSDQANNEYLEDTEKGVLTMVPTGGEKYEEVVDLFNDRHKGLLKKGKGIRAREIAQVENKNAKTKKTNSELEADWKAKALNKDPLFNAEYFKNLEGKNFNQVGVEKLKTYMVNTPGWQQKLIDSFYLHHKEIDATEAQVKAYFAMNLHQHTTKDIAERVATEIFERNFSFYLPNEIEVNQELKEKFKNGTITEREKEHIDFITKNKLVVISDQRVKDETEMVETLIKRSTDKRFMLSKEVVDEAIRIVEKDSGYPLNKDQTNGVYNSTLNEGADAQVSGRAGSGKSTGTAKPMVLAYKMSGYKVIGLGSSADNTKNLLVEAGIDEGWNTEMFIKLVENDKIKLDDKTVLVWDEAAMSDGFTWTRMTKIANKYGCALRTMGESEQLQSVGASTGFSLLEKLGFNLSKLSIINRQNKKWQKVATEQFASGKGNIALMTYHDEGRILTHTTKDENEPLAIGDMLVFNESTLLQGAKGQPNLNIDLKDGKQSVSAMVNAIDEKKGTMTLLVEVKSKYEENVLDHENNPVKDKDGNIKTETRTKTERKVKVVKLEQEAKFEVKRSIHDQSEANELAVKNYMNTPKLNKQNKASTRVLITDTNDNASELNETVREELKKLVEPQKPKDGASKEELENYKIEMDYYKANKVGEDIATIQTKTFGEKSLAVGDRITFKENTKFLSNGKIKARASRTKPTFEVNNGQKGVVVGFDENKNLMMVNFGTEKKPDIKAIDYTEKLELTHSYATTIHSSQGQSIDNVYWVPTQPANLYMVYVACSRQKDDMLIVLSDELKTKLNTLLELSEPTKGMVKLATELAKQHNLDYTDEMAESFGKTRAFLNKHSYQLENGKDKEPVEQDLHPMAIYRDFLASVIKEDPKKTTFDFRALDEFEKELLMSCGKKFSEKQLEKLEKAGFDKQTLLEVKSRIEEEQKQTELQHIQATGGVLKVEEKREQTTLEKKTIIDKAVEYPNKLQDELVNRIQKQKSKGMKM